MRHSVFFIYLGVVAAVGIILCPHVFAQAGTVLMKVGNYEITREMIDAIIQTIPERERGQFLLPDGRKKILDRVVSIVLFAQAAKAAGIDKEPKVKIRLEYGQTLFLGEEYLRRELEKLPPITEEDAKAYYKENKSQFKSPERIKVRHIVVRTEEEAKKILKKLEAGEKFSELAKKYSLDPTRFEGGTLKLPTGQEWLPRGTFEKSFEDVLFGIKKGKIGGPVKSQFGWHILTVDDYQPATPLSYVQVRSAIMNRLKNEQANKKRQELVEKLKKTTPVEKK